MKNSITATIPVLAILLTVNFILMNAGSACAEDDFVFAGENALPDIASPSGMEIGGVNGHWGGIIRVNADDASYADNGRCVFQYSLELLNIGYGPSGVFDYRLNAGPWSAVGGHSGIDAGGRVKASGEIELGPGKQKVVIKLDNDEDIAESDEVNNVPFALRVDVDGKCDSDDAGQPVLANNRNN